MSTLNGDQVKALDQTRQRLLALHTSLIALRSEITTQGVLPSWPALQTHANLISSNLQTITAQLSEHRDAFQATVAFPLPQFPGREQSVILETLLRTKLDPNVEEWVDEGREMAKMQHRPGHPGLPEHDCHALRHWAPSAANKEARKQKWGADFTLDEKNRGTDQIVTGLRRELMEPPDGDGEDDEDDEDEDYEFTDDEDDDKMQLVAQSQADNAPTSDRPDGTAMAGPQQMPFQNIHKFITTGR